MSYLVTFFTHSGAIAFTRRAAEAGIPAKPLPVPRQLSSSCGTGVRVELDAPPLDLLDEDVDKIFNREDQAYTLVYSSDDACA